MKGSGRTFALGAVAAVLATAGVALLAFGRGAATRAVESQRTASQGIAAQLGTLLQTSLSTARLRAQALATTPSVRAAVQTDAATVHDMAQTQGFVFQPSGAETIELFQWQAGRPPLSLLRVPASGAPIVLSRPDEVGLTLRAGELVVTVAAPSEPLYAHGRLRGAVAVATPVDLGPLRAAVAQAGLTVALAGLEHPLALSARAPAPSSPRAATAVPLGALPALSLQLQTEVAAGETQSPWTAPLLLLTAFALGAWALVDERRRPPVRPLDDAPTTPIALNAPLAPLPPQPTVREKQSAAGENHLVLAWSANQPTPITRLVPTQESSPIMIDSRGERLAGRYQLLQPLGRGSGADVYLAQSFVAGVPGAVALKLLQPGIERPHFLQSAQAQRRVTHPNVVQVYDVSVAEELAYVAMEYVEGCTLEQLLRELTASREVLPLPQVLTIVAALCQALDAAEEARDAGGARRPLVHGAVKPANVLMGRHHTIKLADFGAPPSPTDRHAPEQYAGKRAERRSDLYAVGLILHELLTGHHFTPPVDTKQWPALPAPSSLRPELPRVFDQVVAKATRFAARGRYASGAELAADLTRATADAAPATTALVLADWVERARRS